jgi:hypothetical protein
MKAFDWFQFFVVTILCIYHSSALSKYEVILERFESAFGDDDKMLKVEELKVEVKKFNRTT